MVWAYQEVQVVKNLLSNNARDLGLIPGSGRFPGIRSGTPFQYSCLKIPWAEELGRVDSMGLQRVGRKWQCTVILLPGNSHGRRSLVGYSLWDCEESDTTERLHFHLSLSCIGEGNGNPLQCSCLENPRDGEAWWAAVYGVAQSRTQLKHLAAAAAEHIY